MADIFSLARQINQQKKQAQEGYDSPWAELPLLVSEVMATKAKEERVSLKQDSEILSNLIKNASTEKELNNASNIVSRYQGDIEGVAGLEMYGEFIDQQINTKRDAYNQFETTMQWMDGNLNKEVQVPSTDEETGETSYTTQIKNYFDIPAEELMNLTAPQVRDRIKELQTYEMGFNMAAQHGFKYNKGNNSFVTLVDQFGKYKQKLDDSLKASITGGKISEEEAMGIILGDFEATEKNALADINKKTSELQDEYTRLSKVLEGGMEVSSLAALANISPQGQTQQSLQEYASSQLATISAELDKQETRKFFWTGITPDGSKEDYLSSIDGDESLLRQYENIKAEYEQRGMTIPSMEEYRTNPDAYAEALESKDDKDTVVVGEDQTFMEGLEDVAIGVLDTDLGKAGIVVGGAALALEAPAAAKNVANATKLLATETAKAAKFISSSTKLKPEQVTEFLNSKSVRNTLKKIESLEKTIANPKSTKGAIAKAKYQLKRITDNRSKYWAGKFNVNIDDIDNLWAGKGRANWNITKLGNKLGGKLFTKAMSGFLVGDVVNRALGTDLNTLEKLGVGAGTQTIAKRNLKKLGKFVTSHKGRKMILKKFSRKAAERILGTAAIGSVAPGWGTVGGAVLGGGLLIKDIYDFFNNDEVDKELENIEETK